MDRRYFIAGATGLTGVALAAAKAQSSPNTKRSQATSDGVVTADGTRLFVRDWGTGQPIVFLAGWTLPSDFWAYQMAPCVSEGFRCIAYDRRGHGRSSDPGRGYEYDSLSDDLLAVLEARNISGATLVAHSMATGEVTHFLARHGDERIHKVVFIAPTTPFLTKAEDNPSGVDRDLLAASRSLMAKDFPAWIGANTDPFFTPATSPDMKRWGQSLMLRTSMQAVLECARLLAETDFRAQLRKIRVPLLVIHGDRDASAPLALTGQPTAALVPSARLVIYEGGPHGLPLTHSERINKDLLTFIRG